MTKQSFFEQVYSLVATIPEGQVMTYGQIARCLDSPYSAKLVGFAMSATPDERRLPCHRVVNRMGEMAKGSIFGGEGIQRSMLRKEGVIFDNTGKVDLNASLFWPKDPN